MAAPARTANHETSIINTTTATPRRSLRSIWPWLAAALLIGGSGAYFYQRSRAASASDVPIVQTAAATQGEVKVSVSGPGTLAAAQSSSVSATTGGTLTLVPTVGDTVTKGQLIARLQSAIADTGVQNAELALQKARAQLASLGASQASSRAGDAQSVVAAEQSVSAAQSTLTAVRQTYLNQQKIYSACKTPGPPAPASSSTPP